MRKPSCQQNGALRCAATIAGLQSVLLLLGCAAPSAQQAPEPVPLVDAALPAASAARGSDDWNRAPIAAIPGEAAPVGVPPGDRGYLENGPVFHGSQLAADRQRTATERALELKELNDRLSAEIDRIKNQVARMQTQLEATKASLAESTRQREAIKEELAATRAEMARWKDELEGITRLIHQNEQRQLEDLDDLISLVERLVARPADAAPPLTARRAKPADQDE